MLEKLLLVQAQFVGRPFTFLTVARDEPDRVRKYFAEKGLELMTFAEDDSRTSEAWGVAELLEKLLAGQRPKLPRIRLEPNLEWDRDEIGWRDGVGPEFYVVIKPTIGGGSYLYKSGSNRGGWQPCSLGYSMPYNAPSRSPWIGGIKSERFLSSRARKPWNRVPVKRP